MQLVGSAGALRWGKKADAAAECLQPFEVSDNQPSGKDDGTEASTASDVDVKDCQTQGLKLRNDIRTERKLGNHPDDFSLVVFCRDVTAMQIGRDYGVQGDPIYVALYDDGTLKNPHIEFPTCSIEEAGPRIFQSESKLPKVGGGTQSKEIPPFTIKVLAQRTCFDASVEIDLKAQGGTSTVSASYTLRQAVRYHATLQIGPLFTDQQPHAFGLRVDEQNMKHVLDKGPVGRGPEYTATLVLYALPRQLGSLFGGRPFHGRDILHEQSFADRLGGVLGVGLSDPSKRFAAGLSFELFSYVNLTAVYSWARLPQLSGIKDGDLFTGTVDQIPIRDKWEGHFSLGIAIDLRYATRLLSR